MHNSLMAADRQQAPRPRSPSRLASKARPLSAGPTLRKHKTVTVPPMAPQRVAATNEVPTERPTPQQRLDTLRDGMGALRALVQQQAPAHSGAPPTSADDLRAFVATSRPVSAMSAPAAFAPGPAAPTAKSPARSGGRAVAPGAASDWVELKEAAARLQQHLLLEGRRRAETAAALQQHIEARASEVAEALREATQPRMQDLTCRVDTLTCRVEQLARELAVEREKNARLTEELRQQATQELGDVRGALAAERGQRLEREGLLKARLSEDAHHLQERLDVERHARDKAHAQLREAIADAAVAKSDADDRLVRELRQGIDAARAALAAEQEARERGEEAFAAAVDDVARKAREGLEALARGA